MTTTNIGTVEQARASLARLTMLRLITRLAPEADARLPGYLGSMLRGALAMGLKRMVCVVKSPCRSCLLRRDCIYTRLIETPFAADEQELRAQKDIPHPLVVRPPDRGVRSLAAGEELRCELLFFGQAARFWPFVCTALDRAARRGLGADRIPFRMLDATAPDGTVVYRDRVALGDCAPAVAPLPLDSLPAGPMLLRLRTPLRLYRQGEPLTRFELSAFLRTAARRAGAILHYHAGVPWEELDLRPLFAGVAGCAAQEEDVRWYAWERWSNRQRQSIGMGGLVGDVRLDGVDAGMAALLRAAEELHVGKGAIMGLGRVNLVRHPQGGDCGIPAESAMFNVSPPIAGCHRE
ncbi:CRISPR system precrRNA processing endoribonuclease RAMP protein Cas6 [bacterium]|nr:CRISPR system precrRNA processing endoribonuclease RAMP protein Cas6 [bacterium]